MADTTENDIVYPLRRGLLLVTVLVIASCGLVYELIVGTLASYLLGDSILQFSTVIGVYLFSMGIGAWLSGFIEKDVPTHFVDIELAVAFAGGFSAPFLYFTFSEGAAFRLALYCTVLVIGALVGLEIPLLLRILKDRLQFKDLVSQVLTFDYLGALAASLLFPIVFVPHLGLVRTSLFFGLINAGVGLWSTYLLAPLLRRRVMLRLKAIVVTVLLLMAFASGERLTEYFEQGLYPDEVVMAKSSPYQRVVVTNGKRGFSLFLNGNLQFAQADEYRYHEALVHPAMQAAKRHENILVLGGGDGLAVREIFKWQDVGQVVLVDLDAAMTRLGQNFEPLVKLNENALNDARVRIVNEDALQFLAKGTSVFDVVVVDFPDPNNFSLGKLYTTRFYKLLQKAMADEAVVVIQSTSPLLARKSFWCIEATIAASGLKTSPYHVHVPSFGEWGYVLAAKKAPLPHRPLPDGLSFLTDEVVRQSMLFPKDMDRVPSEVNRLDNQILVRTYEEEWARWN